MTRSSNNSLAQRLIALIKEFMQFGMVGALAYVIDVGLFNLFQHGPVGFLSGHPNSAQLLASSIATVFSWLANRYWTYRGRTQKNVARVPVRLLPLHRLHRAQGPRRRRRRRAPAHCYSSLSRPRTATP